MKNTLTYKGFTGSVETEEDGTLYGKVQNIGTLVMYVGNNITELEKDFRDGLNDYLADAEAEGWDPYSPSHLKTPLRKVAQG